MENIENKEYLKADILLPEKRMSGWPWETKISSFGNKKSKEWPKISVITPSFNQGRFIEETIRSVLFQNYSNLEYIIVDAVSTDNTPTVFQKYRNYIDKIIIENDNGQSDAINKGFSVASGDIFCWLNSDDLFLPDTLYTVADYFLSHPGCQWVVGNCLHTDIELNPVWHYQVPSQNIQDYLEFWNSNFLAQPSVFFSKPLWEEKGGCNLELHYAMDLDIWLRFFSVSEPGFIMQDLSINRVHSETKTSKGKESALNEISETIFKSALNKGGKFSKAFITNSMRKYFLQIEYNYFRTSLYQNFSRIFSYRVNFKTSFALFLIFIKNLILFSIGKRK